MAFCARKVRKSHGRLCMLRFLGLPFRLSPWRAIHDAEVSPCRGGRLTLRVSPTLYSSCLPACVQAFCRDSFSGLSSCLTFQCLRLERRWWGLKGAFSITCQLFSRFCWFLVLPLVPVLHLACSSISGYFWHCSWQGKVLQYSSPPHGCDILHDVSSVKLLCPLWISGKNTLHLLTRGTPPLVCYKHARGGRSWVHLLCWAPERRCSCRSVLPGGALAPVRVSTSQPPVRLPTVSASWGPCVWSRRAGGGLVRERRRRAGPRWGN